MVKISDVGIVVNITRETRTPQQMDFGSLAFVHPTDMTDPRPRIKKYTSLTDLAADYPTDSGPYHAGLFWWSQTPMPRDFYVIKSSIETDASVATAQLDFTGTSATGGKVIITFDDYVFTYETTAAEADTDVALGVAELIGKHPWYEAVATGAVVDVTGHWTGSFFNTIEIKNATFQEPGLNLFITQFSGGANATMEPIQTTLQEALEEDAGFYAIALDRQYREDVTQITDCADWVEANEKVFMVNTNDKKVLDGTDITDILSVLKTAGYSRTCGFYTRNPIDYAEIGAFAILATTSFRGTDTVKTLKFKDIALVDHENITGAQLATINDKRGNVVVETAGIKMIHEGITSSGEYLDNIHCSDALAAEITTRVFGALARTSTKIPYTERGMDLLKYEVEGALIQYDTNGFIGSDIDEEGNELPSYEIWSGRVIDASPADKADRVAPNISFRARLASSVHSITIEGRLSL